MNVEGPADASGGSFLLSARRSYLDFIFKAAGFGFVPEYWDYLGKLEFRLSPKDQLVIFGIGALDDVKLFNGTADQRYGNSRILGSNQDQFVGAVSWRRIMSHGFLNATLGVTSVRYDFFQNDSLLLPLFRNASREREISIRADYLMHATEHTEVSIGAIAKSVRFTGDILLRVGTTSYGDPLGLDASFASSGTKAAAYAQVSQDIGPVRVTAGARMDYFDQIARKAVLAPRASLTYSLTPTLNLNASAGRYFQAPSYIWLVANSRNRALRYVGADQLVFGFDQMVRSDTRISVEVYEKNYFDYAASTTRRYLVLANTGAGFGGSEDGYASFGLEPLVNGGSGSSRGVEWMAQKKLSEIPCYGTLSITYSKTDFTALDGVERPGSFDQRWIVNVAGGYVLNEKWEFSAKFRYVTGRPYTPFALDGSQSPAEYNAARIAGNHSMDVRVDRRWSLGTWTLITYIDVQNVYNRTPADVPRYDVRTRNVKVDASIGILPSIGISAEF